MGLRSEYDVPTLQMMHAYEVRQRKDKRGVDLISDVLPYSPLLYAGPNAISNAIGYAKLRNRSADAMIRVYDEAGKVIETHRILSVKFKGYSPKRPER